MYGHLLSIQAQLSFCLDNMVHSNQVRVSTWSEAFNEDTNRCMLPAGQAEVHVRAWPYTNKVGLMERQLP